MKRIILLCLSFLCFNAFGQTKFKAQTSKYTGVHFENKLNETEDFNYFHFDYFYNGGGVAIGDINNDGLQDLFFVGNQVQNKLFLNQGGLKFEDISQSSGIEQSEKLWDTGVSMVDINADGWLDIFVCRSGPADEKRPMTNLLYVNQRDNTFKEQAIELGFTDSKRSVQAAFLDYDRDGDLDVFIINHLKNNSFLAQNSNGEITSNVLYRNDHGKFVDVTYESEIGEYGFSIGVCVSDINQDGWPDIYVANDFMLSDFLYINQKDGTFKNEVKQRTGHIPMFSMGVDIADINNDLLPDIYVADMASEDHIRSKQNMGSMDVASFWQNIAMGEHFQFMFNCLQLNSSFGVFSDIAQLAGVAKTDWSWAPLIADFDNDGWKDIFVSNGIYRDIRNNDFVNDFNRRFIDSNEIFNAMTELERIPRTGVKNYIFKNNGDLTFTKSMSAWGFDFPINSNGASYADLDNDGDLDIVLNNCNEEALIMENETKNSKMLTVALEESELNPFGIGARIHLVTSNGQQTQEMYTTRGFQSSVAPLCYFGIPEQDSIIQLNVIWTDQTVSDFTNIPVNRKIILSKGLQTTPLSNQKSTAYLKEFDLKLFKHEEKIFNDFNREVLLPHKMSQLGPFIGKADVNHDGLEDFYLGGANGQSGELFIQNENGFAKLNNQPWHTEVATEELGSAFFDVDNDGDLDLYVVSGSNENEKLKDKLYLNDGHGNFSNSAYVDDLNVSGQCVVPFDFDQDGWTDLIVPGRQVPGSYPQAPKSTFYKNERGTLKDVTEMVAPEIENIGMVSDVLIFDVDNDKDQDVIAIGEWMGIAIFLNNKGKFKLDTSLVDYRNTVGWWNAIYPFDVNGDGHKELLLGNIGANNKYHPKISNPLHVYQNDFDENGIPDIVLAKHQRESFYPVRGRQCSSQQMPNLVQKFPTYSQYSIAELPDIYKEEMLNEAVHYEAREFRNGYLQKTENKWHFVPFENEMQIGPINSFEEMDVNGDGNNEIIMVGNKYEAEVETARYDGNLGWVVTIENNKIQLLDSEDTGLHLMDNVKDAVCIGPYLIVGCNNDLLKIFRTKHE